VVRHALNAPDLQPGRDRLHEGTRPRRAVAAGAGHNRPMTHPIEQASAALLDARRHRRTVAVTAALADEAAAYAVQDQVLHGLAGAAVTHWKSGGRSIAEQTHAPLPAVGVQAAPADLRDFPFLSFRGIEAEVALRLARDVTPEEAAALTVDAARALVDAMAVTIEVCDSRWTEAREAAALAKLADLQSHGALVVGAWQPFDAGRDWSSQRCSVCIGAQDARVFTGTHTLADPVAVLPRWLQHLSRDGRTVPAGTVVTTGSWCGMLPAAAGDRVQVRFDALGEVTVQL
jgi:2-keto-4-pentenoate hydratase